MARVTTAVEKRPTTPLYELAEDVLLVEQWIHEHAEEITEAGGELPSWLQQMLDEANASVVRKVGGMHLLKAELERLAETASAEGKRLLALAKSRSNAVDALKRYLLVVLTTKALKKVEHEHGSVSVQRNGAVSVKLAAENPQEFLVACMKAWERSRERGEAMEPIDTPVEQVADEGFLIRETIDEEEGRRFLLGHFVKRVDIPARVEYQLDTERLEAFYKAQYDRALADLSTDLDEFTRHRLAEEAVGKQLPALVSITRGYHVRFR